MRNKPRENGVVKATEATALNGVLKVAKATTANGFVDAAGEVARKRVTDVEDATTKIIVMDII